MTIFWLFIFVLFIIIGLIILIKSFVSDIKSLRLPDIITLIAVALLICLFVIKCRSLIKGIANYNEKSGYVIVIISVFVLCSNFIKIVENDYEQQTNKHFNKWDIVKKKITNNLFTIESFAIAFFDTVIVTNKIPKAHESPWVYIIFTMFLVSISIIVISLFYVFSHMYVKSYRFSKSILYYIKNIFSKKGIKNKKMIIRTKKYSDNKRAHDLAMLWMNRHSNITDKQALANNYTRIYNYFLKYLNNE